MAGLDVVSIQDAITAKVKLLIPNNLVIEDGNLDDTVLSRDTHNFADPYVVLRYGTMKPDSGKSIGGARWDEYYSTVDIDAIAPRGRVARLIVNELMIQLTGWVPADSNALTPDGSVNQYTLPYSISKPTTFLATARLKYAVNATNVGYLPSYPA